MPAWLKPGFLVIHVLVGAALTALLTWLHSPPLATLAAVAAFGIAKEYGEQPSDWSRANGGPWNGALDVLSFLLPAWLWWLASH